MKTKQGIFLEKKNTAEALHWIDSILVKHHAPYQITGGLAGKIYGSQRLLADIDIDLKSDFFEFILSDIAPFLISGPAPYKDDSFDIPQFVVLDYKGQLIELCGDKNTYIYNKLLNQWVHCIVDFSNSALLPINGRGYPIIDKNQLIQYKSQLLRPVDIMDLEAMTLLK